MNLMKLRKYMLSGIQNNKAFLTNNQAINL